MPLATSRHDHATVFHLEGRLDVSTSPAFEAEAGALLANGSTCFVCDCAKLHYVSSAGLRAFLVLHKRVAAAGHQFRLCQLQPNVRQVFDMSGFSDIFPLRATLAEALA